MKFSTLATLLVFIAFSSSAMAASEVKLVESHVEVDGGGRGPTWRKREANAAPQSGLGTWYGGSFVGDVVEKDPPASE